MTDMKRLNIATDATSKCLPQTGAIKLPDLFSRVSKQLDDIRAGDFRAAVLRLVDSGEANYQGTEEIVRARPAQ